jgi:hypothetical protein
MAAGRSERPPSLEARMDVWETLTTAAWAVAILLFGWMLLDAWQVGKRFDEDFLLSSREGED